MKLKEGKEYGEAMEKSFDADIVEIEIATHLWLMQVCCFSNIVVNEFKGQHVHQVSNFILVYVP